MKKFGRIIAGSLLVFGFLVGVTACSNGNYYGVVNTYTGAVDKITAKGEKVPNPLGGTSEVSYEYNFTDVTASLIKETEVDVVEFTYTITESKTVSTTVGSTTTTSTKPVTESITHKSPIYQDGKKLYFMFRGPKVVSETKEIIEADLKITLTMDKSGLKFELPIVIPEWNKDSADFNDSVKKVAFTFTKD